MYIQLIGLGGLLKTHSIKIRRVLCLAIANSYDAEKDAFIINGRPRRFTLEDVAQITSMPCDGKKHIPSNLDDNMELWKKLTDRNDTKITFKGLLSKMKGDNTPNFVRPFVLYTIGKYVCRAKEEYVHNKYIGIVRNIETIKGINHGQLTLDYLMDSVKNYVNGEAILEGNLPLLQTCYYEKFGEHQLDSSISYESRLRALIQNWSEEKAKRVDNIIQNNYLGVGEYVEDPMRPSTPAQDGVEDIHLPDLGARSHPMEASVENAEQASDQRKQKDVTEVAAKHHFDDIVVLTKHLQCITQKDESTSIPWLGDEVVDDAIQIMRHDEPIGTRDGQLVYIERVAGVAKLERDGRIEKCYEDALAGIPGTTQGTSYLKHDMAYIDNFRRELPVVLVNSPYNKRKYKKRFKQ
ncbi:hypothetical protein D1007_33024 [Hordeum vulgare]|nr:hypothetical protein D1007_33024 [Hordeum vulgare]